jgi:glycosyltransferase involved in cell wall biosynthesis
LKISIALCTYNGARFLPEQLESILKQTRLPDEIVAVDDCSTDETPSLLREFAARAPFPVHLEVNSENLGVTRNFEKAIGMCSGDIIALCDQDDIWEPNKLAAIEQVFLQNSAVALVFSDAEIVDQEGKPVGYRLWPAAAFGDEQKEMVRSGKAFDALAKYNFITGCTMAFRTEMREIALPTPADAFAIHDGWIALVTAALADIAFIDEPLVKYRQHASQQIGVEAPGQADRWGTRLARRMRDIEHYKRHLRHLERMQEKLVALRSEKHPLRVSDEQVAALGSQCRHLKVRLNLPASRFGRFPIVLREVLLGGYARYSSGLRSAVIDLLA